MIGLARRLDATAASAPDATAIVGAESVSFEAFARNVAAAASALRAGGLGAGDRFAVVSRNSATMLELWFAASASGTVIVPVNHRLSPREVAFIIDDAAPRAVFVAPDAEHLLSGVSGPQIVEIGVERPSEAYRTWRERADPAVADRHEPTPDDVVVQMYTTGTTGVPKGALLTEGNLAEMASSTPRAFGVTTGSRYLALLPMFHISGGGTPVGTLTAGATVVMPSGTSSTALLDDIDRHRITHVNLVPSVMSDLLGAVGGDASALRSLQMVMYGAAPSSSAVIGEMMALLPECQFIHGYGLTECTGGVTFTAPQCHDRRSYDLDRAGYVGAPTGCEIRVVDPHALVDVPTGEVGEVWVRGARTTPGYWNRPEETAALYAEPGWLRTGDIGVLDDAGDLTLKDRLKDMIISGGENVYPAEVEHVLHSHPAVAQAAAYGVPDERWGEAVSAAVTLRPGATATPDELIAYTRDHLAHFKCPKQLNVIDEMPLSGSGKVLRRVLRDQQAAATAAGRQAMTPRSRRSETRSAS